MLGDLILFDSHDSRTSVKKCDFYYLHMIFTFYINLIWKFCNVLFISQREHMVTQIILAREYLKDVNISTEQLKYLVMEAIRGGCQVS